MEKLLKRILRKVEKNDSIEDRLDEIEIQAGKIDRVEFQLEENTKILRALEHKSNAHKTELDELKFILTELRREVWEIGKKPI